jgi:hypothetical protein
MPSRAACTALALGILSFFSVLAAAQETTTFDSALQAPSTVTADYPRDRAGILILSSDWVSLSNEAPAKTHLKHGLAPTFTYGIAPAEAVSDYEGLHAQVQVEPGRPVICICHLLSLPGNPALVILHPNAKKNVRQLDGGNLHLRGKIAEAEKADLIPINVSQPENGVWLIQPQQDLPPGEYALMGGTQNLSIFPFTVAPASPPSAPPGKH